MNEVYENLVEGIIQMAMEDYINSVKKLSKLKKLHEESLQRKEPIKRKKGEKANNYKVRKYKHSPQFYEKETYEAEKQVESCISFFYSDWLKTISTVDGSVILEQCDEKLKKEGYEV